MKVLILNGPAESGKGTVAEYLRKLFDLNIQEYSSIDYVKETAGEKFGWDGKKDVAGRNLLAAIKQVMIAYNDMPTKKVIEQIDWSINYGVDVLVVDIREPDEIEKLVTYCNIQKMHCITCRVHNKKAEKEAEITGLSLTGDRLYGKYDYDLELFNDGSKEDLEENVGVLFKGVYDG